MKRYIVAILILAGMLFAAESSAQQKIRLTDEEIANRIPAGIMRARPYQPTVAGTAATQMPQLVEGWVNPTWSPDHSRIAYTLGNNLYSIDVNTREIVQHTGDGSDVILNGYASCRLIDMALHDMSVQTSTHLHRAFDVHLIADFQQAEVRALEGLAHGSHRVGVILDAYHGEADAIMRNALINLQLVGERTTQGKMQVILLSFNGYDNGHAFYNSGKHNLGYLLTCAKVLQKNKIAAQKTKKTHYLCPAK